MRALQDLGGFLNGCQKAEGVRDEWDVAIDGLWDSDHGERVTAPLGFVKQCFGPALRAVTTDGEENIDAATDQIVHSTSDVDWAPRRAQNRAGLQMNTSHHLRSQDERF